MVLNRLGILMLILLANACIQHQAQEESMSNSGYNRLVSAYDTHAFVDDSVFYYLDTLTTLAKTKEAPQDYYALLLARAEQYDARASADIVAFSKEVCPLLLQNDDLKYYILMKYYLSNYYIENYQYTAALKELATLQKETNHKGGNLGQIVSARVSGILYMSMGQDSLSSSFFNVACSLANKDKKTDPLVVLKTYSDALKQKYKLHNYLGMLQLLHEVDNYEKRMDSTSINRFEKKNFNMTKSFMTCYKLLAYSKLDSLNQAQAQYNIVSVLDSVWLPFPQYLLFTTSMAVYLEAIGKYSESLTNINKALTVQYIPILSRLDFLQEKVKNLKFQDRYKEMFDTEKIIIASRDSIYSLKILGQLNELEVRHRATQLKEQEDLNLGHLFLIAMIALSGLIFIFFVIVLRSNLSEKNKLLSIEIDNKCRLQEEIHQLELEDKALSGSLKEKVAVQIFIVLEEQLKTKHLFVDPQFNRDVAATLIGTNRTYLIDVVKEETGLSFGDYINSHRLEYARKLLSTQHHLSIKEVYLQSGFLSKATFYRLFVKKYIITPAEYKATFK